MAEPLEIVVTARDETSRVLDTVRTKFTGFGQELERIERGGGRTFDALGGSVGNLAIRFTRVLDPALGGTVSRLSALGTSVAAVTGGAGSLATVIGGTVVAAVAVGALGLNTYINTLSRLSQEQAKTNALLNEMDFGGLVGRAQGLNRQMQELQATFSAWQAVKNITTGALNDIGGALDRTLGKLDKMLGIASPGDLIRRWGTDTQAISEAQQARNQANAAVEQLVPGQRARLGTAGAAHVFNLSGNLAAGRAQEAIAQQNITVFLEEMDRIAQARSNELSKRQEGIALEFEPQFAAARSSGAGPGRMALLQEDMRTQQASLGAASAVTFESLRRQRSAGAEAIGLALSGQLGDPNLSQVAPVMGTEADAALSERRRAADLAGLDIVRQRAEILGEITPELNAQLILMERDLLLSQSGLTIDEQGLINARATLALLEQQSRLDPLAGLTRGFSEATTASREWGSEMLQVARETDRNMSRTFSDGLFNLFTGRKGEDLGKQFGESVLRSITDTLGRQASGAVSGIFAQLLGGARGAVPSVTGGGGGGVLELLGLAGQAAGPIVSPTGAPAGQLIMTAGGQLAQVMPSGALTAVGGGSGGGGLGFDPNTVLSGGQALVSGYQGLSALAANYAAGGVTGALFGVETVVVGGQTFAVSAGTTGWALAESGGAAAAGTGTAGLVGQGGALFGSAAGAVTGGALAAVALGFTIYGGLTQEATAQNIAINAISGALSGAVLGAAIGFIGGPVGSLIGAAIGAIAGGALAGGTTGLKAPKKMTTGERSLAIGEAAATNLINAIDRASSIEDLVTIFNTRWAPHQEVRIQTHYQGTLYTAETDLGPSSPATPALMVIPEFLDQLVIQAGESGAPRHRQDLIDAFRAKRDELLGILSNVPFAILEHDAAAGISRRTYQPFQTIYGIATGTQQLVGSSEFLRRDQGADDATIDFLMDRIRERSIQRDVDMSREDFMFR